jgi:hypothetical protein
MMFTKSGATPATDMDVGPPASIGSERLDVTSCRTVTLGGGFCPGGIPRLAAEFASRLTNRLRSPASRVSDLWQPEPPVP